MALIFQRLARNFIKNGYFPTDEVTLERIVSALDVDGAALRILDPCCGEGTALAEVKQHLTTAGAEVTAFGIEYDRERAWHAKTLLDRVAHADFNDCLVGPRSVGLLFLNPPYGHAVADKGMTGDRAKTDRLEKQFFRRSIGSLQFGGILVLIVPYTVLDAEFSGLIARHCDDVRVFMAPETRFKQAVIFGRKRRADRPNSALQKQLEAVGAGQLAEVLPEHWSAEPYRVPAAPAEPIAFTVVRLDPAQLAKEIAANASGSLWPQFARHFGSSLQVMRRPLRDLSRWHLALALAAGQISGVVQSADGRRLLIKGDTFKDKDIQRSYEAGSDGEITETTVATDKFVPCITGIDFTPGPHFGELVTIR